MEDTLRISDIAAKYEMTTLYEMLGGHVCPIHRLADVMEIMRRVPRDNIGWLFDIYQFHVADGSLAALEQADFSRLKLFHITDVRDLPYEQLAGNSRRALPGQGIAQTREILEILARKGFAGPDRAGAV